MSRTRGAQGGTRAPDRGRIVIAAATVLVIGYALFAATGLGDRTLREITAPYAVFGLLTLTAFGLDLRAARTPGLHPRSRRAWWIHAGAMVLQMIGGAILVYQEVVGRQTIFRSLADVAFLAFTPTLFVALMTFPTRRHTRRERLTLFLDVLVVGMSVFMILWYLEIGPIVTAGTAGTLEVAVSAAGPVGDLMLVGGVVTMLFRGVAAASRRSLQILLVAMVLVVATDVLDGALGLREMTWARDWIKHLWVAIMYLFSLGAYEQRARATGEEELDEPPVRTRSVFVIPYAAVVVAYALLLLVTGNSEVYPIGGMVIGAVLVTLVVMIRQFSTLSENREMARSDPLTGLYNRAHFMARLDESLAQAKKNGTHTALLLLDLDKFKAVNDTLGHDAGDAVLVSVAHALRQATRDGDTVGRLGGDEFVVVLDRLARPETAAALAGRLLNALNEPVVFNGHLLSSEASIGVAVSDPTDSTGSHSASVTAEDMMQRADAAMHVAKRGGRNRFHVYAADSLAENFEAELARALDKNELVVMYQPIVELASGRTLGVEALIRWQHPTHGLLRPQRFVPQAEEAGMIGRLGNWVLDRSCRQLAEWTRDFPAMGTLTLNVNVSTRQVRHPGFVAEVTQVVDRYALDPRRLVVELTESAPLQDDRETDAKIEALRGLGIRVAVDDFGTEYSTLSFLRRLPADILKIDQTFILHILDNEESRTIGQAIIDLGHALKLEVVAEGIETEEQLRALKSLGCKKGQGFLFSRPVPPAEIVRLCTIAAPSPTDEAA